MAFEPRIFAAPFDQCGITSNNPIDYHNQLRHFVQTQEIMDDIQDEDGSSALPGIFSFDGIHELDPTYTLDRKSDDSDSDSEMPYLVIENYRTVKIFKNFKKINSHFYLRF